MEQLSTSRFRYLKICGVYDRSTIGRRLRVWYTCILLFMFFPIHLAYVLQKGTSDLMETCEEIMLIQVSLTSLHKFSIFVVKRKQLHALFAAFQAIYRRVKLEERNRFAKCYALHSRLAQIYITVTMIVAILYTLNAVSASISLSMETGGLRFVTPMNFPFDYQHPAVFVLSFIYNLDTMIMSMCISVTVDTCFSELANNLALHFDIVGKRFAALDFSGPATATATRERELIDLIAYHGELLELTGKMVACFRQVIFFLLLVVSTILCMLGYEFVVLTSVSKRLQVVGMAGIFITQAIIYTYNGSIITEKSAMVSEAIYASNWYEGSLAEKKMIYFCLMRAQKAVVMKGGFINATLPTFKKILSSSGSYITMLLSFESNA